MNYSTLIFNSMPYNRTGILNNQVYYVGVGGSHQGWIKCLSKNDYHELKHIDLWYNVSSNFEECKYFYHTRDNIIKKLDINTFQISTFPGHHFPKYKWEDILCYHNLLTKQYEVFNSKGEKVLEFKYHHPIIAKFISSGILIYQNNEKENNWIKCLNPDGGDEIWKVEFSWQFVRLETFDNLIILEYHAFDKIRTDKGHAGERDWYNPDRYTIVLNGDTGEEIWRYSNSYHHIDYENEAVLIGNIKSFLPNGKIEKLSVVELDIYNGNVLTEIEVKPPIERIHDLHFVDGVGIYYTSHDGSFGKINKADGAILWEFDLVDNKGEKRKISDWLLLGNGNLVLQTLPNHPNGDFTCIFNPIENMEYSNVIDGVRLNA